MACELIIAQNFIIIIIIIRHISVVVQKANFVLGIVKRAFTNYDVRLFTLLYKTLVRPHLEYAVQAWCPHRQKDIKKLESVQKRATRLVPSCRGLSYEDRLQLLNLPTLEARRKRGDLILVFRIVHGLISLEFDRFFSFSRDARTRGHRFKLDVRRSRGTFRQHSFSIRVVNDWNSLPGHVVEASSVDVFKVRYDNHIRSVSDASLANIWTR